MTSMFCVFRDRTSAIGDGPALHLLASSTAGVGSSSIQTATLITVIVFLVALTGIGVWHARRIRTAEDFALAGRNFGPFVLSGTLIATWIGTGSIFGNSGKAYSTGIAVLLYPLASAVGILLLAYLAPLSRGTGALTVPQILGQRFGRLAQVLGASALILAYMVIVSYQYRAGAAIAAKVFPAYDPMMLRVGFAVFIIAYTALAGMVSVAWTDVANGLVLAAGIVISVIIVALGVGLHDVAETKPVFEEGSTWWSLGGGMGAIAWIGMVLPAFLLVLGDANLHQRFMSARSPKVARQGALIMFAGVLVLELCIIALALMGKYTLPHTPSNPGHVIIDMGFTILPPVIGVIVAATCVAIIVSTADSFLLGSATSLSADFVNRKPTPLIQRTLVLVLGAVAFGVSLMSDQYFEVALYAYTLYGASLTPAILCALLRPTAPRVAVVASMATGLSVALLWQVFGSLDLLPGVLADVDAVIPALGLNLLVLVVLWKIHGETPRPATDAA